MHRVTKSEKNTIFYPPAFENVKKWWQLNLENGFIPNQIDPYWETSPIRVCVQTLEEDFQKFMRGKPPEYLLHRFETRFRDLFKSIAFKCENIAGQRTTIQINDRAYTRHHLPSGLHYKKNKDGGVLTYCLPILSECREIFYNKAPETPPCKKPKYSNTLIRGLENA